MAAVLLVFILFVDHIGFFNGTDNHFYDLSFRMRGPGEAARNIILIAIDDKSLERLGRWPIDRRHYASLLGHLSAADVVAFDLIMADPSADDAALEKAARLHGRVVFPVAIDDRMYVAHPAFGFPHKQTGHIQVEAGIDGVVREVYHTLRLGDEVLYSFSSLAWEMATGKKLVRAADERPGERKTGIVQADRMAINYAGGPGTFERVGFSDVLDGVYPASFFKNRVCIVGLTATGGAEILLAPFSEERKGTPGVEVHANAVSTLMLGNGLRSAPPWVRWAVIVLLGMGCFFSFLVMNELRAAILAAAVCVAVEISVYALFSLSNVWFAPSAFLAAVVSVFAATYAFKFHDAVHRLDRAYRTVLSHLRRHGEPDSRGRLKQGMRALLTPGGVSSKAEVLGDITDRLIFEKQLTDTVIFSDVQGVLLFGPGGAVVLENNLAAEVCRANGIDTASGGAFTGGIGRFAADGTDAGTILAEAFSGGGPATFNVCFPVPQKKYFKLDVTPLSIQGETYTLLVFSDITTVKELEMLKSEVVTLVSHEIKTPLASIQGFSEMLAESAEGDTKQYAVVVQKESERLIRFLNTFLDIARIEEGRQPISIEPVDLPEVAAEVTRELSVIAEENGIVVRLEAPEGLAPAMADRDLVQQCIINLAENAIKYSESGKDVVVRLAEEVDCIRIETIDSGTGIREEELGRVFEKFYRARSSERKSVSGSGLGLAFVKQAVEAQGGTVSVESRYGHGSRFTILLPKGRAGEGR